tara:strand:+ start:1785 stop:2123 length:339 start_codon:yes stop_codon:yes gene_type:complete
MVSLNTFENINGNLMSNANFANHVPSFVNRNPIKPIDAVNNPNAYDAKYNRYSKRYSVNEAPSNGSSTEAFLKSRTLMEPTYIHNEAKTKYLMVSALPVKSSSIKESEIRYF